MTEPTPEDVERVARAIYRHDKQRADETDWESVNLIYEDLARSALAALPDHSALIRELRHALDSILIGGNHLALNLADYLGTDFAKALPPEIDSEVAREEIDDPAVFNIWVCWQSVMRARAALRKANEALGERG